jgi:hypothetical protein
MNGSILKIVLFLSISDIKMSVSDEEAYRHFKETLMAELKQNIKPVIISLTMLADDYKLNSQVIAKSINEYIKTVNINNY